MRLFQTDNRILSAAEVLFCRFGIKGVTMDDIARQLGMSKKTLYKEFEDKNAMIVALVDSSIRAHHENTLYFEKTSQNAVDEILQLMRYMGSIFGSVNPNVFYDMQRYHPEAWQHFRMFREQQILQYIIRNLEKGREQGLYRADINIKILAVLRMEQLELALNPAVFPPERFNISEVNVQLLDHFLHGICTLKGHKLINKYMQKREAE
jgi:AcrR family transcriptional regulator